MSPEQASGQPVDFRSDQFALRRRSSTRCSPASAPSTRRRGPRRSRRSFGTSPSPWPRLPRGSRAAPLDRRALPGEASRGALRVHAGSRPGPPGRARPLLADRQRDPSPLRCRLRAGRRATRLSVGEWRSPWRLSWLPRTSSARRARPDLPSFRRLTFRDGTVWTARLAADGQTIVYGAALERRPRSRSIRRDPRSPESVALPLPPSNVLAISPAGEIAISLGARPAGPFSDGRYARALYARRRRCPRDAGVRAGRRLGGRRLEPRVLRAVDGRSRIEFPPGKTARRGPLRLPRLIRGCRPTEFVAYLEHPMRGDDGGSVVGRRPRGKAARALRGLDLGARARLVAGRPRSLVHGGAGRRRQSRALRGDLRARTAPRARVPGSLTLHDISREGRVLLARGALARGNGRIASGSRPKSGTSRGTTGPGRSTSRRTARRFSSTRPEREAARPTPSTSARPTAPRRAARRRPCARALARRQVGALDAAPHPGGARAAADRARASRGDSDRQLRQHPSGGLARRAASSSSLASERARTRRAAVRAVRRGEATPVAVTPEGDGPDWAVSPDGSVVAAVRPRISACALRSKAGEPDADSRNASRATSRSVSRRRAVLYVLVRGEGASGEIHSVDVTTGIGTLWKEIAPADPIGVFGVPRVFLGRRPLVRLLVRADARRALPGRRAALERRLRLRGDLPFGHGPRLVGCGLDRGPGLRAALRLPRREPPPSSVGRVHSRRELPRRTLETRSGLPDRMRSFTEVLGLTRELIARARGRSSRRGRPGKKRGSPRC